MIGPFPEEDFLALHRALATTPGPSLHEGPRRAVLERVFRDQGLSISVDGAGSLWVRLGPSGPWSETVVFDAHMDVVEKGFTEAVTVTEEHLQGLGVGDDLVAVSMLVLAGCRLRSLSEEFRRPLRLLFSVGEEGLGNLAGVRRMVSDHPGAPALFVAFDGTLETYSLSGLGSLRHRIVFDCPGGHSWGDFGAPSATHQLVEFLHEFREAIRLLAEEADGPVSFNIGALEGGEGINSISRHAEATFEVRAVSPEPLDAARKIIRVLTDRRAETEGVSVGLTLVGERPAARPVDSERIRALVEPLLRPHAADPRAVVMSTNINVPLAHGWPSVRVGLYRGRHAHREDEQVDRDSLPEGWAVLDQLCETLLIGE